MRLIPGFLWLDVETLDWLSFPSNPAVAFPLLPHCSGHVGCPSSAESLRQHLAASVERTWSEILVSPLSEISWRLCSGFYLWWWVVDFGRMLIGTVWLSRGSAGARLAGPSRATLRDMHGAIWTQ